MKKLTFLLLLLFVFITSKSQDVIRFELKAKMIIDTFYQSELILEPISRTDSFILCKYATIDTARSKIISQGDALIPKPFFKTVFSIPVDTSEVNAILKYYGLQAIRVKE